jgi:tetratricopeptide (TPR) repeat protein
MTPATTTGEGPSPLLPLPSLAIAPLYPGSFFPPPDEAGRALLAGDVEAGASLAREVLKGSPSPQERFGALLALAVADGLRGRYQEALDGIDAAEAALGEPDDAQRVLVLANRSAALVALWRLKDAEHAAAEALRAGRRMKDDHQAAVGGFARAMAHLARGRRAEARTRLAEAVRGFAKAGDVPRQVQCHHLLGEIAYDGEDPIRAGSHYRDGLALARPAGALAVVELLTLRFEHR